MISKDLSKKPDFKNIKFEPQKILFVSASININLSPEPVYGSSMRSKYSRGSTGMGGGAFFPSGTNRFSHSHKILKCPLHKNYPSSAAHSTTANLKAGHKLR